MTYMLQQKVLLRFIITVVTCLSVLLDNGYFTPLTFKGNLSKKKVEEFTKYELV